MNYLSKFDSHVDYIGGTLDTPNISVCIEDGHVHYMGFPKTNGYDYVDLGLPSGTLGATCNVGASSPEQYGDYYACGEIIPNKATTYTPQNYRFYPGNDNDEYTKYNSTDNKMTLDLEDDAANVAMGSNGHMPTIEQCEELINNTVSAWTSDYNDSSIAGTVFTAQNGNSLFIPAAGDMYDEGLQNVGSWCHVCTSSLHTANPDNVCFLSGRSRGVATGLGSRYCGYSVRGVISSKQQKVDVIVELYNDSSERVVRQIIDLSKFNSEPTTPLTVYVTDLGGQTVSASGDGYRGNFAFNGNYNIGVDTATNDGWTLTTEEKKNLILRVSPATA